MNKRPLNIEDARVEIFAHIVKAGANKYGCDMFIDL